MTPLQQLDLANLRILDGGMATELDRRGYDISGPLWSARILEDSPGAIAAVHSDYLDAGADCLLTASYQVSSSGYAELGHAKPHADQALRLSVRLAETVRDQFAGQSNRPIWIAASLGPYGAALHNGAEYHGNYNCSFADLVRFHTERLEVLSGTNADLVAFETVPSLQEAEAILEALHSWPNLGAWISFTCRDGQHVGHGEPISDCGALLQTEPQVVANGINCTSPRSISSLLRELKAATTKLVIVYPNSGEQWDAAHRCWRGKSDTAEFGKWAREWFEAGAQAVGGCCRTGPEHIRAIRDALAV